MVVQRKVHACRFPRRLRGSGTWANTLANVVDSGWSIGWFLLGLVAVEVSYSMDYDFDRALARLL
jgi:hypothetical protein